MIDYSKVPQIRLTYSHEVPPDQRCRVETPLDVYGFMSQIWEDVCYRETAFILLLTSRNHILGYFLLSIGGLTSTTLDIRMIFQAVYTANAGSFILIHNHPSGLLKASNADIEVTNEISKAADLLRIGFYDHIIITNEGYFSFVEKGLL